MFYKIPLLLTPQPDGGFTVTSPLLPELITEGDSIDEVLANVQDALEAVIEMYEDLGKQLPYNLQSVDQNSPALIETIISVR
ncbi:type II toxin-antitoxin system HicB family antitoxin [Anabaena sp. UHCC 0253]|uniref:type II toxin-antitoxin system HicB family antitoxin n=1 Tax=Anabaena sp. UHCC 0253 TaxID=2590019 RepID=UPI0014467E65|nr:type II toxin-antitoxin system HicB family antitoxin [Anabaena sp. UHCC 0253]MTJ51202.1 type II toxin-antitoxin system HicB family antitoxin [Anabaena sp. UHCC 0253]